jgi:hypothetical protein
MKKLVQNGAAIKELLLQGLLWQKKTTARFWRTKDGPKTLDYAQTYGMGASGEL